MSFIGNYLSNLKSMARGRQPLRPLMFSYYVTHRCRLNCSYCCDGDGKRFREDAVEELGTEAAKKLISLLSRAADTIDLTGGEPLERDDMEVILCHAKRAGMLTVLNTKGTGLASRPDIMENTDVLVLSLDTLDRHRLASLIGRPVEQADEILDSLEFSLSRMAAAGTRVVLSCVATPKNIPDVGCVLSFAVKNGIGFHLSPEIMGTVVNPDLRNNSEYRRLIDRVIRLRRLGSRILGVPQYLEGIRDFQDFPCHPLLMPTVRPDGMMYYPCLEAKRVCTNLLCHDNYDDALTTVRQRCGEVPKCGDCCHIFCHMALSLLQRHPISALGELLRWMR